MDLVAQQISAAAHDSEPGVRRQPADAGNHGEGGRPRRTRRRPPRRPGDDGLTARLEQSIAASTAGLLTLHKLDAGAARTVNERVRKAYVVRTPVDARQAGLLGAVVSGAASGLSADLLSGGLSFGAAPCSAALSAR